MPLRPIALLVLVAAPLLAADPYLAFSDLDSGPATGNGDTSRGQALDVDGALVTVWGENLGASQADGAIRIGGVAARIYAWGDATPPAGRADLHRRLGLQRVVFQVPAGAPAGATTIVASVAGHDSNSLAFTVRAGGIRFVATTGSDNADGSWAHPWRTLPYATGRLAAGDTCYALDGVAQTTVQDYNTTLDLIGDGEPGRPKALVAYPGARVVIGSASVDRGIHCWYSGQDRLSRWWTLAQLDVTGGQEAIIYATGFRLVANHVTAPTGDGATGTVTGGGDHVRVIGNEFTACGAPGCSKLYHPLYVSAERADSGPRLPTESDREVAWNWYHANNANRAVNIYSERASSAYQSDHRVHHNWIEDQVGDAILIGGMTIGETWVYDNVVLHAGRGPEPTTSDPIGHGGIHLDAGAPGVAGSIVHVRHNTVVDCGWSGAVYGGSSGAFLIVGTANYQLDLRDNLVVSTGQPYLAVWSDAIPAAARGNLWWGAGAAPAWDTAAVGADPRFVAADDVRLQADSPAIDRAGPTIAPLTRDLFATPRPQGTAGDLGACERAVDGGGTTTGGTTTGGTTTGGTTSTGGGTTTGGSTSHGGGGCGHGAAPAGLALALLLALRLKRR